MMKTGILLMFAFAAEEDLKKRTIPVLWVIIFFALLFGMRFLQDRQSFAFAGLLAGALPGIFFFLICLLTKGEAGGGDALIILLSGILTGFWNILMICFLALVITGLFGLALMAAGKAGRKTCLPFAPFLLLSYVILLALGFPDQM